MPTIVPDLWFDMLGMVKLDLKGHAGSRGRHRRLTRGR